MSDRVARVVADADVLAADLLLDGPAREALDVVRSHAWIPLVASEPLLSDAQAVIADEADDDLAADWRERIVELVDLVEHPAGDHPALASARHGTAGHLLTYDSNLRGARTGTAIKRRVEVSVKTPEAFLHTFDPAAAYEAVFDESYPGPDRDPRA